MADMSAVLALAAKGNVDAQAAMLDHVILHANGIACFSDAFMGAIETWARILASHGRPEDVMRLAGVMIFRAGMYRHAGRDAESRQFGDSGLAILAKAAEQGSEDAANRLVYLSDLLARNQVIPGAVMMGPGPQTSH